MTAAIGTSSRGRQRDGTVLALGILGVSLAQAVTPLARTVDYTYPAITVLVTLYLLRRGRTDLALEANLWAWVTAPGLRRVVDWSSSSFNESSPVLATPAVAALLIGISTLHPGRRWPVGFGFGFFVYAAAGGAAALIGAANSGILPMVVSALLWFAPIGVGLALLTAGEARDETVTAVLRFCRWALLGLSGYALLQWAVSPAWDVFWLANVSPYAEQLGSPFGTPEPFGLRPASTSNSPYVFAHTLVWLLVSQVGARQHRLTSYIGVGLGCVALGLTGIRAAWLTAVLVVLVLVVSRKIRLTPLVVTGGVAAFLLVTFVPTAAQEIGERLGTVQTAATDVSLLARVGTYTSAIPAFLGDPIGAGLGSTGSGARANPQDNQAFQVLDSSYLEVLRTAGAVLGGVALLVLLAMCVLAYVRAGPLAHPYAAWGAIALVAPVDMLLGSVTSGAASVVTWLVIGACAGGPSVGSAPAPAVAAVAHPPGSA